MAVRVARPPSSRAQQLCFLEKRSRRPRRRRRHWRTTYSLWGSNPQPMAHKTIALTTELREPFERTKDNALPDSSKLKIFFRQENNKLVLAQRASGIGARGSLNICYIIQQVLRQRTHGGLWSIRGIDGPRSPPSVARGHCLERAKPPTPSPFSRGAGALA